MTSEADERRLRETSGCLVLEGLDHSSAHELGELYRAFAVRCVEKQFHQAMVCVGQHDPAGEQALRCAVTMMLLAGIPRDFRLALVTGSAHVAKAYSAAQRDLRAAGVAAQLFDREQDASHWLEDSRETAWI